MPMSSRHHRVAALTAGFFVAACAKASKAPRHPAPQHPISATSVGSCANPDTDGVVADPRRLERADRDLDGDGRPEPIRVDRSRCDALGNCYWNVFVRRSDDCVRFAGSLGGAGLELLPGRGDGNVSDVRAYWHQGEGRMLLQDHRFTQGGYQVTDILLCRRQGEARLLCGDEQRVHDRF